MQLAQASVLADVLSLLDNLARVELQHGIANAVPDVKDALWRRYVVPALGVSGDKAALASPLPGRLVGQWTDGRKNSVRIFDMWADGKAQTLAWSRDEFSAPMKEPDRVLARDAAGTERAPAAKLVLYVDLGALPEGDRERIRSAQARSDPGELRYVLDDTGRKIAACLDGASDSDAPPPGAGGKAGKPPPKPRAALIEISPAAEDDAEARCRRKVVPDDLVGKAILFDPARRVQVLESRLGEGPPIARILTRAAAFARAWP